jgi:hypothetical protein
LKTHANCPGEGPIEGKVAPSPPSAVLNYASPVLDYSRQLTPSAHTSQGYDVEGVRWRNLPIGVQVLFWTVVGVCVSLPWLSGMLG